MTDDIKAFPVTGYDIKGISNEAIMLRLSFLSSPMQSEPNPGRNYVLSLAQATQLRDAIDRAIANVKNHPPLTGDMPKH